MPKEILIVDDEPSIVVQIQFLMEQQGYKVIVAKNGEDALDIILKYKPDLILLDIRMPEIDGFEVCKQLKSNEQTRDIPVLFISLFNDAVNDGQALLLCPHIMPIQGLVVRGARLERVLDGVDVLGVGL